jgi:hypothetical protein
VTKHAESSRDGLKLVKPISKSVFLRGSTSYRANTCRVPTGANNLEVVVNSIKGVYGVIRAAKVERYVHILATGNCPILVLGVIFSTLNAPINRVRDITRDLAKEVV